MNKYVAQNTDGINGKIGKIPFPSGLGVVFDFHDLYTPPAEQSTMGTVNNNEYIDVSGTHYQLLAYRHNGGMNFICADGHGEWTTPGNSNFGEKPIYRFYSSGVYWKDGAAYSY